MHIWTDKEGNKLTASEFTSRWKEGIQKVSALDKVKMQLIFTFIVLFGIIIGLISVYIAKTWWLLIILIGAFGLNALGLLGTYQQYLAYKKIEDMLNVPDGDVKEAIVDATEVRTQPIKEST